MGVRCRGIHTQPSNTALTSSVFTKATHKRLYPWPELVGQEPAQLRAFPGCPAAQTHTAAPAALFWAGWAGSSPAAQAGLWALCSLGCSQGGRARSSLSEPPGSCPVFCPSTNGATPTGHSVLLQCCCTIPGFAWGTDTLSPLSQKNLNSDVAGRDRDPI